MVIYTKIHCMKVIYMSLDVKEKIDILKKNAPLIDAVRRCHTSDKRYLSKAMETSWPTVNASLKNVLAQKNSPVFISSDGIYEVKSTYGFFVGIAVGGSETKFSILSFDLKPIKELDCYVYFNPLFDSLKKVCQYKSVNLEQGYVCYNTPDIPTGISDLCNEILFNVIDFFKTSTDFDLLGIGVTFPGVFGNSLSEDETFKMSFSPNLSRLVGTSLIELFDIRILNILDNNKISFIIGHDTEAVTVFEKESLYSSKTYYQYRNKKNISCIYLGIGLGMGIIIDNKLLHGSCNSVGEIGHLFPPDLSFVNNNLTSKELEEKNEVEKKQQEHPHYCYCGVKNCLENQIRTKVFNAYDQESYINNTSDDELLHLPEHTYRYKLLKAYIMHLMNLMINILNLDVIVLSGRILNGIEPLKYEVDRLKLATGLSTSSNSCKIIFGNSRADIVALGAATLSYFGIGFAKNNFESDKHINIKWTSTNE